MVTVRTRIRICLTLACLGIVAVASPSCGGGSGGPGPEGPGQGLVFVSFTQAGVTNVSLNETLEFGFSEALDPASVTPASFQIREGSEFGLTAAGTLWTEGARLYFEPRLPNLCDLSDGGFKAETTYRITLVGYPEEFCLRNTRGQPLDQTLTLLFTTTNEGDPELLRDQRPGELPSVRSATPGNGDAAVDVASGNEILLEISENLDPCTVTANSVTLDMYERGDPDVFEMGAPSGNASGFVPVEDQAPTDPTTWGGNGTAVVPTQRIPCDVVLSQSSAATYVRAVPRFGRFPENSLLVLRLTAAIQDLGGYPLTPATISFTTENVSSPDLTRVVENEGETPYIERDTTADVNTDRSPSKAQGFKLFAGDGDNGMDLLSPSGPEVPSACTSMRQENDGALDHFNPSTDVTLDTGAVQNTCPNTVDGSMAVVWEFASFTIAAGRTVRIVGVNPAILLVTGNVSIQSGGTLTVSGASGTDGNGFPTALPPPQPTTFVLGVSGGEGVAGGGNGGDSRDPPATVPPSDTSIYYGEDGYVGVGSPAYPRSVPGGHGAGRGAVAIDNVAVPHVDDGSCSAAGGGGGHATYGDPGGTNINYNNAWLASPVGGEGGAPYPTTGTPLAALKMIKPSAGSGGGAAGYCDVTWASASQRPAATASGGAGGGGGGFVDITSAKRISVHGTILATGGKGGDGGISWYTNVGDTGGGGGGSGGGIRLLAAEEIDLAGATISAAGGAGGTGTTSMSYGGALPNHGGNGGNGRIVLEDPDGVITGMSTATVIPGEGTPGFYRGPFDVSRFQGGGSRTQAVSEPFLVGAFDPVFEDPEQVYGTQKVDFVAGIPSTVAAPPDPQIVVEAQGYQMRSDGTADLATGTGWRTVGYFSSAASAIQPHWDLDQVTGPYRPADNTGPFGISGLDGCEYMQIRFTFYMGSQSTLRDAGPYVDRWTIRFSSNH